MTYYNNSVRTYEFTAFTEADLLQGKNGGSIGRGDTFTMPGSATTCFSVEDNDRYLSGDACRNESGDDRSYQRATIDVGGDQAYDDAKIYAESYHKLRGSDGKTYYLIEIEVKNGDAPGKGDDFFTFYGRVPPAGVELKVVGTHNVKGNWVDFKCLDAGMKWELDDECRYTIEAEDMSLRGYKAKDVDAASGDALIKLKSSTGYAKTNFGGEDGEYNIEVCYVDENDGEGFIDIFINGKFVGCISLDENDNGNGVHNVSFSSYTIEGVELKQGDSIKLKGRRDGGEYARIDKIVFEQVKEPEFRECDDPDAVKIDFEGFAAGTVVADQYDGVTIVAQRNGDAPGSENDAMVFDSANPTGGDSDLATANQGNLLIVSEDNDSGDPDDNAGGGMIEVRFDNPAKIFDVKVVDTEEGGEIELFGGDGASLGVFAIPSIGDGEIAQVLLDTDGVARMKVTLNGSGAIDDICYVPGEDPPGALSGTYFCDDNRDGVDNGADTDVAGKLVMLFAADGVTPATDIDGAAVAAVLTDAEGNYRFDNLAAGDYVVMFENSLAEGKVFVAADVGSDDTIDSDVLDANGKTAPVTVVAGEETRDVDAGVVDPNDDPEPMDDRAAVCSDASVVIDVLANDSDPDADALTITHVDGMAIAEGGTVTLASGAEVSLNGGKLGYDLTGADDYDGLLIGDAATDQFAYTASDGNGGSATATVDVDVWGALNTLDTIAEDIDGTAGTLLIQRIVTPLEYEFPVTVASGDARIDGTYDDALAYCVEKAQPFPLDTAVEGTYYVSDPDNPVLADVVGNEENLDLVNWILNQQFETLDAGTLDDGDLGTPGATGANYLHLEVQDAIWFLTDDAAVPNPGSARAENTQEIIDAALAMGEDFEAGAGDLVGLVFEPTDANLQSYIVGVPFDDLAQDCVCA